MQTSFFKIQTWNENVFWIYWVLYELKSVKKNDFAKGLGTSLRLKDPGLLLYHLTMMTIVFVFSSIQ